MGLLKDILKRHDKLVDAIVDYVYNGRTSIPYPEPDHDKINKMVADIDHDCIVLLKEILGIVHFSLDRFITTED